LQFREYYRLLVLLVLYYSLARLKLDWLSTAAAAVSMAVQAQYPSNALLPSYRNRARPVFGGDNLSFLSPLNFNNQSSSPLDEFQIHQPYPNPAAAAAGGSNPLRTFNQLVGGPSLVHQPAMNATLFNCNNNERDNELACTLLGSRKRAREGDVLINQRQQQQHQLFNQSSLSQLQQHQHQQVLNVADYRSHATGGPMVIPPPSTRGVSTGLHLTFEDDQLNSTSSASTSGRGNISSPLLSIVSEDLSTQIQQESEEIKLLFKAQGEQVCQLLEEKRQQHSRALLAAIEEGISQRFRDKDLEMENMKRQNLELAEHVKQLSIKVHNWQAKARANEAMVTALKSNLQQAQQAVALSLEQSKEGCGDSEADDAASSHHGDDDAHARTFKENRELREQRTCRVCRCNDVSILLLPCRHLCLCKECEARLDACPLCRSLKNASVQVYMS
jgi:E3 ubiquitin-protein ligase BOI-like protein